jgi:hypothetical protein
MMDWFKGLLEKNVLTAIVVVLAALLVVVAAVAAITGNYDSESVRAFVDDIKYIVGILGAGVAVGRGIRSAGEAGAVKSLIANGNEHIGFDGDDTTPVSEPPIKGDPEGNFC